MNRTSFQANRTTTREGALAEMEDSILRNQEPSATFKTIEVPGISQGRQSRVSVLEFRLSGGVENIVWKRMGVGKGLTAEEANMFHARLRTYRRSLRLRGWNIPKLFHTHTVQVGDEWQIYSYEQYIPGGDADYSVRQVNEPNFRKWQLIRAAVETLAEYPADAITRVAVMGKQLSRLDHGLDLKLANLVNDGGIVYFVDLFGTKELTDDGAWLTYSPKVDTLSAESLLAVCGTREGAILRLYRLAERSWVASGSITQETLRREFRAVLAQSGLARQERDTITAEIEAEYPWLDRLYAESAV